MIEEFYKRKIIRDFLSLYSEVKWKELLFLLVEYAIFMLKRNYNVASLSLEDIIAVLDDLKEEETRRFRQSMRELNNNRTNIEIGSTKPPSDWRQGIHKVVKTNASISKEKPIVKKKLNKTNNNNNIYPEWWGGKENINNSKSTKNNKLVYFLLIHRIEAIVLTVLRIC
jgi:hypothetical protein